jgi:hypothetical protein
MGFWCSLAVEIIGGLVTAVALGVGAAFFAASQQVRAHDERIDDLYEDNRRWFRDRDRRRDIDQRLVVNQPHLYGGPTTGALLQALARAQQDALHDYRDELSAKRRRYREIHDVEGPAHGLVRRWRSKPIRHFALSQEEHGVLVSWRANVTPDHWPQADEPIEDPTSEELEPDLRRFEREGDPPPD